MCSLIWSHCPVKQIQWLDEIVCCQPWRLTTIIVTENIHLHANHNNYCAPTTDNTTSSRDGYAELLPNGIYNWMWSRTIKMVHTFSYVVPISNILHPISPTHNPCLIKSKLFVIAKYLWPPVAPFPSFIFVSCPLPSSSSRGFSVLALEAKCYYTTFVCLPHFIHGAALRNN